MALITTITAVRLAKGTKEYVDLQVVDETGVVTSLVGTNPKFDTFNDSAVAIQSAVACVVGASGMLLQCLIDTTLAGYVAGGTHYSLFAYWTIGSESPREGPFDIYVI